MNRIDGKIRSPKAGIREKSEGGTAPWMNLFMDLSVRGMFVRGIKPMVSWLGSRDTLPTNRFGLGFAFPLNPNSLLSPAPRRRGRRKSPVLSWLRGSTREFIGEHLIPALASGKGEVLERFRKGHRRTTQSSTRTPDGITGFAGRGSVRAISVFQNLTPC
jgi:hypothetical protein